MNLDKSFGENAFLDGVQKRVLPKEIYDALKRTIRAGKPLDTSIAGAVASAMKEWAISRGATHYTHWFQPLTGLTAQKHESFLEKDGDEAITRLTGKSLIVGESDASSFPSGGTRATHMARGYTAWDPTSPAFVRGGTLYIPSVFLSHTGETLDNKAPLLRSMSALDEQAKRLLKLFDIQCERVISTVGLEQEYFLIDEKQYLKRKDLRLTGRTLFGAKVARGQEFEDNYFGVVCDRVAAFMRDIDEQLWSLGVASKCKHNEVAPAQREIVIAHSPVNVAVDENMLAMEILKATAKRHSLACLLHEKPFKGINGSGKHSNWSLCTDTGLNLLEAGDNPENNTLFKLILTAIVKAADEYQGLLRASVASCGNDLRLGADEAPPAIISIYLGDLLGAMAESIVNGKSFVSAKREQHSIGIPESPIFPKDATDRNRTSPFAFTGNKFEFRSLGAQVNAAEANICLNTIVADAFESFASELEKRKDMEKAAGDLIARELKKHYKIIYNSDGYGEEWVKEARERKLLNNKTTADAVLVCYEQKNIDVFVRQRVYSQKEAIARADVRLENYIKSVNCEGLTMIEIFRRDIFPAVSEYIGKLCGAVGEKRLTDEKIPCAAELNLIKKLSELLDGATAQCDRLESKLNGEKEADIRARACFAAKEIIPLMDSLRSAVDQMETLTDAKAWVIPTYYDLLYSVN